MKTLVLRINSIFDYGLEAFMMALVLIMAPTVAFAQTDIDLGTFVNQIVADAQTLHGLTGSALYLAIFAFLIFIFTSLIKVSVIRNWIAWDAWPTAIKTLWAPVLGVLMVIAEIRPFTIGAVMVGLFTGLGAVALQLLLNSVETLPGINDTILFLIKIFSMILGGNTGQLVAKQRNRVERKLALKRERSR